MGWRRLVVSAPVLRDTAVSVTDRACSRLFSPVRPVCLHTPTYFAFTGRCALFTLSHVHCFVFVAVPSVCFTLSRAKLALQPRVYRGANCELPPDRFQMISLVAVAASESSDCADGVCNESFDADAFVESTCEMLASRVSIDGLIDHDTGRCGQWAAAGECDQNPDFMHERCQLSCLRRLCLASEYAMPAEYGLPPKNGEAAALALAAAIHATLGSSWLELQTAGPVRGRAANERCVAQAGASLNDEATRLLAQTWQTGIPGDNGCALTAESAAIDVRPWTDIC